MTDDTIPRRQFLKGAGAAGTAVAAVLTPAVATNAQARAQPPAPQAASVTTHPPEPWLTLNPTEQAFITAAVDTIIPADELSPSGSDCGVATFIDRQLAGAYGAGARLYRQGPFPVRRALRP
jgi:gluconate 2-dehydrogenase gamma chain